MSILTFLWFLKIAACPLSMPDQSFTLFHQKFWGLLVERIAIVYYCLYRLPNMHAIKSNQSSIKPMGDGQDNSTDVVYDHS